jgi:hypothetical protein
MSVNQLIARGVAPVGQDLPQIGNMLMQRQQMMQQNALAQQGVQNDAVRANAFAQQVQGQQQNAAEGARREALQRSFDVVAQAPDLLPQFVGDLRQSVAPDLPDNATLDQIAFRLGLEMPAKPKAYGVTQQEGPFGSRIVTDGSRFQVVEPQQASRTASAPAAAGGTSTGKFGAPRMGVNPDTGRAGYFQVDEFGNERWLNAGSATAAEAEARVVGKTAGSSVVELPQVRENAQQMFDVLFKLKNSPLNTIYGAASVAPVVPGTAQADAFALWDQVNGKAFLQAFESLKGGGQITEKEGERATAAITRLGNRKMSPGAAQEAIRELQAVAFRGLKRAEAAAGRAQAQAPAAGGNVVDFGSLPD